MTLLEKIKNYKWFDSPNKLRAILEELYNSIGGGSGGGSQDLQSVLDTGGVFENVEGDYVNILSELDYRNITFTVKGLPSNGEGNTRGTFTIDEEGIYMLGRIDSHYSRILCTDTFEISRANPNGRTYIRINDRPGIDANVDMFINFPGKIGGTYTLATLDDIKKIDLTGRVYENNAAATSGGLTVNDVYRTSTGELRIVV